MTIIAQTVGTNSTRDYDWLKAAVASWLHRDDLADTIPDFVMLAEKRINGMLEARAQDLTATLTTSAGVPTVDLPNDLNSIHSLSMPIYGDVDYMDAQNFGRIYAAGSGGVPRHYTIIGGALKLGPIPDGVYSIACTYRAGVPALADSGGSNWLIEQHAEIYLAATMCEACVWARDDSALSLWEGKYAAAVAALNNTDWNVSGPLVVRSDTRTP